VHIAVDAASYFGGKVAAFGCKTFSVPQWPGLVTSAGNATAMPVFGIELSQRFPRWDDLIAGASPPVLRTLAEPYGLRLGAEVWLAGISAERGPEAFVFYTDGELPDTGCGEKLPPPFVLRELVDDLMLRPVANDQVVPAHWTGIHDDDDVETVHWKLKKVLTMQRFTKLPDEVGGIGGFGTAITISADAITQRVVCRWPEDQIGIRIRPGQIDWDRWHRDNPKPGALPMSKLKRDMAARRDRKQLHLVR
jgi:hypothetical protein